MSLKGIEEKVLILLLGSLVLLVFIAACFRYFNVSIIWSVEVAQLLFAWVCFVGADLTLRSDRHIGVDLLLKKMPPRIQNFVLLFLNLLIFVFLSIIFIFGVELGVQDYQRTFNTIDISYSYVTFSVPVGAVLLGSTTIGRIRGNILYLVNKGSQHRLEGEGTGTEQTR